MSLHFLHFALLYQIKKRKVPTVFFAFVTAFDGVTGIEMGIEFIGK